MKNRPRTLAQIAEASDSLWEFGRHLRDWLHELRTVTSRAGVARMVREEPVLLGSRFEQGDVADAWLGSYAEHLCGKAGLSTPAWAFRKARISPVPLFDETNQSRALHLDALINSPPAFKRRNVYTPIVDLPLKLRAGRPKKTSEEKRKANAERQRRFRQARAVELEQLRASANQRAMNLSKPRTP